MRLAIWVRRGDEDKCGHAMASLKKSMRWDEDVFGLEYDLDVFNIVAVSDFNMGAMENKGLNVFNTRYVLAKPETATDTDYQNIEAVIAHEYFHNWTGNRVTCRDWFQLSLKEGLTVFRDQLFSADQGSPAVCRIGNIRTLRAAQFPEDAGPLAHPVQPDTYLRIDNFYTATVYNKGAEIIRMIHTLLGPDGFRRGMDAYIARNDNRAATIERFSRGDAAGRRRRPRRFRAVVPAGRHARDHGRGTLRPGRAHLRTRGRSSVCRRPRANPKSGRCRSRSRWGCWDRTATSCRPGSRTRTTRRTGTRVLVAASERQVFRFADVPAPPVPSLLRNFSAPVKLRGVPLDRLKFLAVHDTDPVARWDAGQQVATRMLLERVEAMPQRCRDAAARSRYRRGDAADSGRCGARSGISGGSPGSAKRNQSRGRDAGHRRRGDPSGARERPRATSPPRSPEPLTEAYGRFADRGPYRIDGEAIGRRALRNVCLFYLAAGNQREGARLAKAQFDAGANMTDVLAALSVLIDIDSPEREAALEAFYTRWARRSARDRQMVRAAGALVTARHDRAGP